MQYRPNRRDGPTAGAETVELLEFRARLVTHIPNKHHGMTRYYAKYASRSVASVSFSARSMSKKAGLAFWHAAR